MAYLRREIPLFSLLILMIIFRLRGESLPPWIILIFWLGVVALAPKKMATPLIVALMVTLSLQLNNLWFYENPSYGLPEGEVVAVRGRLVDDAGTTLNGNTLLRLKAEVCHNKRGEWAGVRGILLVVTQEQLTLHRGRSLECRGEVVGGALFVSKEVIALSSPSRYSQVRSRLLGKVKGRLESLRGGGKLLIKSLLLGESSLEASPLREMVTQSGCAHILALSGMHLNSLVLLFTALTGRLIGKQRARWLSLPLALFYVALVGFKPSLVRSLLMLFIRHLIKNISVKETLTLTLIAHLLLFPDGVCSVASLLSYSCLAAILWGGERCASPLLLFLPPKGALMVGTTLVASLALAPLSLLLFGAWYPIGLILSPLMAALALFLLTLALTFLVFPLSPLKFIIEGISRLFYSLANWGSSHTPWRGMQGWAILLIILLTILTLLKYATRVIKKRYRQQYDLELSLQFPPRHNRAPQRGEPRTE